MVRGFYLVDKKRSDVEKEVGLFRQAMGVDILPMFYEDIIPAIDGEEDILLASGERVPCPDFVFIRAFRLTDAETYHLKAVLRMLESKGVLCINPAYCKDVTADKFRTFQVAQQVIPEIPIPKTVLVTPSAGIGTIADLIGYPVVLKTLHGEGGSGVVLVNSEDELKHVLSMVRASMPGDQLIAQQAIMSSAGRDLRVMVLGDRVIGSLVRVNRGSFTSNVHQGGSVESYDPPENIKEASVRFAKAIGMVLGSVDFLFGENEGEFYLCEANSSIGLSEEAQAHMDMSVIKEYMRGLTGESR